MRHQAARLLRCLAYHLDPRGDIKQAQDRYRNAINAYVCAERELLYTTQHAAKNGANT